jgi:hypothetical protein
VTDRLLPGNLPVLQLNTSVVGSGVNCDRDREDESEMGSTSPLTSLPYPLFGLAIHQHNSRLRLNPYDKPHEFHVNTCEVFQKHMFLCEHT